ncbi:MAG: type II secretion system F family protein, partial [Bacteroidota bacterium]
MIELRFNAIKTNGQIVTGGMTAPTYREGKSKIHQLIEKHKLKLKSIEKKATFIYKIKKGN